MKGNGRKPKPEYRFDKRAASTAVAFFENLLVHIKGEWAGKPFVLQDWERDDIVRPLFGWKRADGSRKYRIAYIEIPRSNGKSTLGAGIGLLLLFLDEEQGGEVYSVAGDRDQAAIVHDLAKHMVEASPVLAERAELYKRAVVVPLTHSVYRVLSADVPRKHGLHPHGVIFDEFHVQKDRELWDVLTTGTGSRRQPLVVVITTAGYDRESICWELHEHARQVLAGVIVDEEFFAYIRAADPDDDWTDPKTWRKANPSLGVTITEEYLASECRRAQLTPAYENTFRRLHLNQWTSQETRWMPMEAWDACDAEVEVATGQACYGGLDLASSVDIASLLLDFPAALEEPELHQVLAFFWIPEENLVERARRDRVPYEAWARANFITVTPGNVIDYARIGADIVKLGESFNIRELAFDRWGAIQMSQQLEGAGFTMVPFGQGFASMSAPTKELLRLVLDKKIAHGGNPVLRWMADNVVVRQDPAGNLKPDKAKSREKIDGIVALIMAIDRAQRHGKPESVYEQRGLVGL